MAEFTHNNKDKPLAAKYRYQIEFNYGRRGSKVDIAAPTCADLISMNYPSFQQCYGCPYKFLESSDLKAKLANHGLHSVQVEEVANLAGKNDYQLACSKHFEIVNDYQANEVISSPNRYFELSQMIKQIKSKPADNVSAKDKSLNDLYDKHLWEMLSPTKDNAKKAETSANDPMSQFDFNF